MSTPVLDLRGLAFRYPGSQQALFGVDLHVHAGERVALKAPRPPSARYVLIWMTGLPQVDGGYKGGIREVKISS